MLLKLKTSGTLVEACSLKELTDPCSTAVSVKSLKGYRNSAAELVEKSDLTFVSGEALPSCWMRVVAQGARVNPTIARYA